MKGRKVLVVEDDVMLGAVLVQMLEELGHVVCALETTEAGAVAAAAAFQPDLMLVDVRLAEGDGVAAVKAILLKQTIPHLFMSGNAAQVRIRRPGALVLEKPFRETELVHALAVLFSGVSGLDTPLRRPGAPLFT